MRAFRADRVPSPTFPDSVWQALHAGITDVEIGAGQGLHAINYGRANPDRKLLAIERTEVKFERLVGRLMSHPEIRNVIPVRGDAISVITHCFTDNSLERIYLLYPNPYPKRKQRNLRWYNSPFMGCLINKLKSGGRLYLSTNLSWYAEEARTTLTDVWQLTLASETLITQAQGAQTHFEKKYLLRGETCHRLIFVKEPGNESEGELGCRRAKPDEN